MSVGGIVVSVSRTADEARVIVAELAPWKKKGPKLDLLNATGIRCGHKGHPIELGDTLWWHGPRVMLSPLRFRHIDDDDMVQGVHFDILLERLGYSHGAGAITVSLELEELAAKRCAGMRGES